MYIKGLVKQMLPKYFRRKFAPKNYEVDYTHIFLLQNSSKANIPNVHFETMLELCFGQVIYFLEKVVSFFYLITLKQHHDKFITM